MRPELMPSDVLETVLAFLTGFDAFELSHASHEWFLWLSNPAFWCERLHGAATDTPGPPWMKDLKGSANRLRQRMRGIVQRDLGQHWKRKYVLERSVLFRGMGPQDFIYRRQRGPYAYLEHNVATESRQQRPMAYLANNTSLSFDVWFCLLPDTRTGTSTRHYGRCAGGVIYGLDCDDLGDDQWQPVVVDSKCNLYCSLLDGRTMVAANLATNRWHHLALAYNREKQTQDVYVDGLNVHSSTGGRRREWSRLAYQQIGTGHVVAGDGDFPYPGYSGTYDFRGLIDEFRVWQGVLAERDVVELARGGTLPYRDVWASMKLPGRKTMGLGLECVRSTRPVEDFVLFPEMRSLYLRAEEIEEENDPKLEERGVTGLVNKLKASKLGQKAKDYGAKREQMRETRSTNRKYTQVAKLLAKDGATLDDLFKTKITPDQLYNYLGLESAMRLAYYTGNYAPLKASSDFKLW